MLGQKNEFKFWCEIGWFLHGQSIYLDHVIYPDDGILETTALPYAGPILVPGSLSLHIR